MEYLVKSGSPEKQRVGCVIVGIFDRRKPSTQAEALDKASNGLIASTMRRGDMDGKLGQTTVLHGLDDMLCDRILLVGCGKERDFNERAYKQACSAAARALDSMGGVDAAVYLTELNVRGGHDDFGWSVKQALLTFEDTFYRFEACKGSSYEQYNRKLTRLVFQVPRRSDLNAAETGANEGMAIAKGQKLAKDLANLPGNICTPSYLADQAQQLADEHDGITTQVLEEADMEELGMGALLGVSRGSRQPAKLIVMEYMNGDQAKPTVLVGKGVTFDAGGISIKPGAGMDEMKFDMCGAASVYGAMKAAVDLDLPINLVGVIPATENLPDGNAYKPGDILTTLSGQTVEIINTDAEGRLALADALTYVEQNYDADAVVNMATLTGAAVIALGSHASALYSNNSPLRRSLRDAGDHIGDRAWPMPLWEDYQSDLDSNFADMANAGGRAGGSITAACFLHRFTRKMRWAHLDIAGTAWHSGKAKGASGRPVGLLTQYLIDRATQSG